MTQDMTEQLLNKPYWIIDILPKQVPADSAGQYFSAEQFFLRESGVMDLGGKYLRLILKLNCYYDLSVSFDAGEQWTENPEPEQLKDWFLREDPSGTVHIMIHGEQTMAVRNADDTYMTIYNPAENLLELLRCLAAAEGLFVWKPGDGRN